MPISMDDGGVGLQHRSSITQYEYQRFIATLAQSVWEKSSTMLEAAIEKVNAVSLGQS